MFNIQKKKTALWQFADFARVNVNFIIAFIRGLRVLIAKFWRIFLQEGADMFARGIAIRARAIHPAFRVN